MLFGEQVVGQGRRVGQALDGGIQEAGVAQVVQPCAHTENALPPQGQSLDGEEHFLWSWDSISSTPRCTLAA
jgi:hypothetical protein